MKSKALFVMTLCLCGPVLAFGQVRDVTIAGIPGVVAPGATWQIVRQGTDNADGIVGTPDGGLLFAQEQQISYGSSTETGNTVLAFDIQTDGTVSNRRDFAKLASGSGDGMAVDASGRLYDTAQAGGVQVFSPDGQYLGTIPTPRNAISVAFSGRDKKTLYSSGALGPDGKEFQTPQGVRNNAKTIYKIPMLSEGFKGRAE